MVTPESTGTDIAMNIFLNFLDLLISDLGGALIDDIGGGFFEVFVTFIFGGGLSVELGFLLIFSLIMLGIFYKYVYAVVN